MNSSIAALLTERFSDLEDPRIGRAKRHELIDVVVIAISAVICGADSWVDVEMYGKSKRDWLDRFLSLPNGIPSHDTFGRVFARLDPNKAGPQTVRAMFQAVGRGGKRGYGR